MALNYKKPSSPAKKGLITNTRKKVAELETKTVEEQDKEKYIKEVKPVETYKPELPFNVIQPTFDRLSFNQPKLVESDLPITTNKTAPITGKTLGIENVKTYQAPIGQSKKELDAKDKADKKEAKALSETLEKKLSDKYGFKVKRANSPIEYANILLNVPENKKEQFKKDYDEYILAVERSNPFRAGAEAGFNILPTNLEKTQGKETVEEAQGYGLGRFVGGAGQQAAFASVFGAPIEGLVGKVLPKATPFVTETIKDVAIGTGTQLAEAPFDKPTAGQFVGNVALDIALNALFGVVGKGLSKVDFAKLKTAKPQQAIEEVTKQMGINESEASDLIDKSIDFYVNQGGIANAEPFEQLQLPAPKEGLDAFTQWRKDNFGGAFGKLTPEDDIAMKQLYKEETGIDLIVNQREVPKTVLPSEMSTKPITQVRKAMEETAQEPKQTITEVPKIELSQPMPKIDLKQETPITPVLTQPLEIPTMPKLETPMQGTSQAKFTETVTKSEQTTKPIRERIKQLDLETTTDKARVDLATKIVDETPDEALSLVLSGDKFTSDMEGAIGNVLYGKLQSQGRYDDALEVINALAKKARKAGQEIQILSLWSKTSPEGMARWTVRTLEEAGVDVDAKLVADVTQSVKNIQEATPEQLAEMIKKQSGKNQAFVEKFIKSEDGQYLKDLNTALVMKKVTDKLPIATARQISTVQAMSHLLNGRTFSRNILGNTINTALEQINKPLASAVDRVISIGTGRRTVVANMPKWQVAMGEAIKEGKRSANEILLGVNRVGSDKYDVFFESAFKDKPGISGALGKAGKAGEKALSLSLATPDEFFKGFAKADSLFNQVRARLGKKVDDWDFGKIMENATPEEIKRSVDEAKFLTFQDDSLPATMLSEAKRLLNRIGYGKEGPTGIKEFGLGDLVVKYTRVPGNIIARSIDYSPIGFLKLLKVAGDIGKNAQAQREFAQVFSRAFTGSSIGAVGYALTKLGVIIDERDTKDYNKGMLEKSEGTGGIKLNLTGLSRALTGGDPKLKEGDKLADFNWIPVISTSLSVGSKLANADEKEKTLPDLLNAFAEGTVEQMTDLPTMYTIKSMMNEATYNDEATWQDVASIPIKEALPGFIPSIVRQFAQYVDPVVRETKGADSSETARNKILANLPFLSKKLEPKITPLGKEQTRETGILKSFVLPSTTTTYKPTGLMPKLEKIETLAKETSMYPDRKAPNSFTIKVKEFNPGKSKFVETDVKETIELTPKEKTLYQQIFGQEVEKSYDEIFKNNKITNEKEATEVYKLLQDAESEARAKAKEAIMKGRK